MTIKTKNDWWEAVDEHWDDLLEIFARFLPMWEPAPQSLRSKVSETNPQVAKNAWLDVERCKHERNNIKLEQYLFAAWESAPDNHSIHSIPSWGVLCDLLSENWVFYEEEEGFATENKIESQ